VIFIVLSRFISNSLPRHAILFADPLTEINELAALGTKRPERIIPPLDLFVAGWTFFHEPELSARVSAHQWRLVHRAQQPLRTLDQNSPVNELDRTFAAHCVQAYGDAFSSGSYDGSNFPVRQGNINQHSR
jgi:hypothetical protein